MKKVGDEKLAGSKYLCLYSKENLPQRHKQQFQSLKKMPLKTGRAWAIKKSLGELWRYLFCFGDTSFALAIRHFKAWFFWAPHSHLEPVKPGIEKARSFRKYLRQILTYFRHRIINAVSEGLNSRIETIRKMAYGFRNRNISK